MKTVTRSEVEHVRSLPCTTGGFRKLTTKGISYCAAGKVALLMTDYVWEKIPVNFVDEMKLGGVFIMNDERQDFNKAFNQALSVAIQHGWLQIDETIAPVSEARKKELAYV